MEIRKIKIISLIVILTLTSCFDIDYKGFLYSSITVDERFADSEFWNQNNNNHLKIDAIDYKFIVAGDSHIGGIENIKKMFEEANKSDYSFVAIVGDVTTGNADDYIVAKNTFDSLTVKPLFLIAGNHDLYYEGWENFYKYFGASSYIVEIETNNAIDLLIFLDTGSATLGKKQLEWLTDILENKRDNYRNCLLFSHVNFYRTKEHKTGSTNFLAEELIILMDLFYDNDVEFVFSGHDHNRYIIEFAHTQYITLDAIKDNFSKASYFVVENNNGEISYKFVDL